jgi:hypothetical protein
MSDPYYKVRHDVGFRKEVAEKAGLGFKLPPQKVDVGPKGPKWTETPDVQLAVSARMLYWLLRAPAPQLERACGATPDAHKSRQFMLSRFELMGCECGYAGR